MRDRGLAALLLPILLSACVAHAERTDLVFTVVPTVTGADIEVEVHGGPGERVWIGFGVGPGVAPAFTERIHSVYATSGDGIPLDIRPHGEAGYAVRLPDSDPWRLGYSVDLRPRREEAGFYRSSVRDDEYLVMVGSDLWARIYGDPAALSFRPDNRPPGHGDTARVTVDLPPDSDWVVVGASPAAGRAEFRFTEHATASVLVAGSFEPPREAPGLRIHVHPAWSELGVDGGGMTSALMSRLRERLGPPDDDTAVVVMMPLPAPLRPARGLRTAGMVRDHTALLYGGLTGDPHPRPDDDRIVAATAVFIAHELFHLYVPSAVQVTRKLSWLSEGWAMHMGRLAAQDAGLVDERDARLQAETTYRRYLDMGGYRAGSLPEASMGAESMRDLLYLRGELVFRLLAREWARGGHPSSFEEHLWQQLQRAYRHEPLDAERVHAVLTGMVDPQIVRRYVVGTAPLTQGVLGFDD